MLKALGITDPNIELLDYSEEIIRGERKKIIAARLTCPCERCPYCGFMDVIKNGSRLTMCAVNFIFESNTFYAKIVGLLGVLNLF